MRSVRISEPGQAELLEEERPQPGTDEVLVHARVVALNNSDLALYEGKWPDGFYHYPVVPGHAWSGVVAEVGAHVQDIEPGQKVVAESIVYCGKCRNCRMGLTNLCEAEYAELGFTRPGGLAEYVVVPARLLHVMPAEADLEELALLASTANVAEAFLRAQPRPGDVIAVMGSDATSLLAVQIARLYSPAEIVFMAFREERLRLAREMGATRTIRPGRQELGEVVTELTHGRGADVVFEGSGHPQAVAEALQMVRRAGTVVLEGTAGTGSFLNVEADLFAMHHLSVYGIFEASIAAWTYALQLYEAGQLHLTPLISHRFPLDDYQSALDLLLYQQPQALQGIITL
ncbi:MAG TPA: alcohol dehydrogenase catalytic domain-containing protein [Ktedonobacteraceae bacterium]